jgi:hypothetical protein
VAHQPIALPGLLAPIKVFREQAKGKHSVLVVAGLNAALAWLMVSI